MEENKNEGYDSTKKHTDETSENIENEAKRYCQRI